MKSLFFALSAIMLIFSSCQKEMSVENGNKDNLPTVPSPYYIKCKLDGVAKTFNYEDTAAISMGRPLGNRLDIQGFASPDDDNLEGFGLAIHFTTATIGPGTYSKPEDFLFASYSPNHPTILYIAGLHDSPVTPSIFTITTITNKEVTGTFKCTVYETDTDGQGNIISMGDNYKIITEGEFRVPIVQ